MAAISAEVDLPVPAPDTPSLFRCAAPGAIAGVFVAAGLSDVAEAEVRGTLSPSSAQEYWDFTSEVAAPVVAGLAQADGAGRERIRAAVIEQISAFGIDGKLSIPIRARCTSGTR